MTAQELIDKLEALDDKDKALPVMWDWDGRAEHITRVDVDIYDKEKNHVYPQFDYIMIS